MSTETEKSQAKRSRGQPHVKFPASTFYVILLCVVLVASIGIGRLAPSLIPQTASTTIKIASEIGGFCVAFVLLHLLVELSINNKQAMKKLWPLQQVSRFRNWLWSGVVLSLGFGMLGNYLYEQGKAGEAPHAEPPTSTASAAQPVTKDATEPSPTARMIEPPAQSHPAPATPTPQTPVETAKPEGFFSVTFAIPTRYRDLQIMVDGEPARVTDRQLSQIKLQVPRKSTPARFTLQSNLLGKPREFTLQVDHDNFEYSPFQ